MANDLIFFWNDRLHSSQATPILSASSTAGGYAPEFVREAELERAWKPNDSASTDEWLKVDGGSTTWLGNGSATAYFAVAYDARGSNQTIFRLQTGTTDDGAFAAPNDATTHTLNTSKVTCWYTSFSIPSTAKRWYRLLQKGTDRSGGNVTAKILGWSLFQAGDITSFVRDFPGHSESAYPLNSVIRASRMQRAGAGITANKFAAPGYDFTISVHPANDTLFTTIRDQFDAIGGWQRAIYVLKTGIPNAALADFFMCRLAQDWSSSRKYLNQSDMLIPMTTEPWL